MKKIIVSVTTDLISDQRVHKMCLFLSNSGNDVLLVGRKLSNDIVSKRPYKVKRFNMFFRKGFFFYMFFNIRLFFVLVFTKCDAYLSNDLDTLIPNFLASKIKKKPLVYDSHELFTEVPELINKKFVKSFWLYVEKKIFPKLKNIITVSEGISLFYKTKYKKSVVVVKNVPLLNNHFNQKKEITNLLNYNKNKNNIIYQGSLNKDRGIKLMIDMMEYLDANLFLVGSGDLEEELKENVKKKNLQSKVFFVGRVPFEKLKSITAKFDLGLSFEEDTCLAYRFSLPNKVFDYIHAGVPVLTSNLPDVSRFVKENNVGEVLDSRGPKNVALQIKKVLQRKEFYDNYIDIAKNKFCWEHEGLKIIQVFKSL